jgi:hypothetical protein
MSAARPLHQERTLLFSSEVAKGLSSVSRWGIAPVLTPIALFQKEERMEIAGVTWAAAAQALASVVGFSLIIYQIWRLKRTVQGDTQSKLYAHYLEVNKLLLQKPFLRPYFYEGKVWDESGDHPPNLRQDLEIMCEVILGLCEHAVLQYQRLPPDAWNNCWRAYIRGRYAQSPVLRQFFETNQIWYVQALGDYLAGPASGYSLGQEGWTQTLVLPGVWRRINGIVPFDKGLRPFPTTSLDTPFLHCQFDMPGA